MKFKTIKSNIFKGAKDENNKIVELAKKFDFDIEKIEKGELSIDDAFNLKMKSIEENVSKRLETEVENKVRSEIYAAAHTKNEKLYIEKIGKALGLSFDKYETVEKNKRFETMLEDGISALNTKITEIEGKFTGANPEEIKKLEAKYQKMLDELTGEKTTLLQKLEEAVKEGENKVNGIKKQTVKQKKLSEFMSALKDPSLTAKQIDAIVESSLLKYDIEIEEDGRVWMLVDGKRTQNPTKPTENLTLESFLNNLKEEYGFEKKSNGNPENPEIKLPGGVSMPSLDQLPKGVKEQLEKNLKKIEEHKKK